MSKTIFDRDFRVTKNSSIEIQLNGFSWSLTTGLSLDISSFDDMHRGCELTISLFGGFLHIVHYDHRHEYD